MKPNLGLAAKSRDSINASLATLLADEHVLYVKLRNYHWNVKGPHFGPLHALFEEQYTLLADSIDEIAERIRTLGGSAPGTMKSFLKSARLKEDGGAPPKAVDMIKGLLADHESLAMALRKDIVAASQVNDEATADFLTGLLALHEKAAWFLRSHLE